MWTFHINSNRNVTETPVVLERAILVTGLEKTKRFYKISNYSSTGYSVSASRIFPYKKRAKKTHTADRNK